MGLDKNYRGVLELMCRLKVLRFYKKKTWQLFKTRNQSDFRENLVGFE